MNRSDAHFVECGGHTQKVYHAAVPSEEADGDYVDYFVACRYPAGSDQAIVFNYLMDNTLNTDWGDSGTWHYSGSNGSTTEAYDTVSHTDGSVLVVHNSFSIEANTEIVCCAMLDSDGLLDTTWGHNGFYNGYTTYQSASPTRVIRDNSGNYHLFSISNFSSRYTYQIFNSSGTTLYAYDWQAGYKIPISIFDAVLSADGTRIIAVGADSVFNGKTYNVMAFDVTDGTIDTTWAGNLSEGGYALAGGNDGYSIERVDDGYIICHQTSGGGENSICKLTLDGAVDTTWGTNGYAAGGLFIQGYKHNTVLDGVYYTLAPRKSNAESYTAVFTKWTSAGAVDIQQEIGPSGSFDVYHYVEGINSQLFAGTRGVSPATNHIEQWSTSLVFVDGFDLTGVGYIQRIVPNEYTRETTDTEAADEYWTETEIGYGHLEGETVTILADGVVYPDQVVTDGAIDETAFADATIRHIGLKYESKLKPMKPVSQPAMMSKRMTCKQMGISVHNTDAIECGVHDDDMTAINFDDVQWKNKCAIDGLFTGTVCVTVPDGFSVNCPLQITTSAPLPATVRAMIPKVTGV